MIDEAVAKHLGAVEQAAKAAGIPCENIHSTSDFPDEEILKVVTKHGCDLIVMGSHGQSGLVATFAAGRRIAGNLASCLCETDWFLARANFGLIAR